MMLSKQKQHNGERCCALCGEWLPLDAYAGKSKLLMDGTRGIYLHSYCKECMKKYHKRRSNKPKELRLW